MNDPWAKPTGNVYMHSQGFVPLRHRIVISVKVRMRKQIAEMESFL